LFYSQIKIKIEKLMDSSKLPPTNSATPRGPVDLPFWISILAGLPVAMCMAIMGVPDLSRDFATDFRILFLCTFVFWIFPLAWMQRSLWQTRLSWFALSGTLLLASFLMSAINNVLGMVLAIRLGLIKTIRWEQAFSGLDGCWLAFIAYFAIHAVLIYYVALDHEKTRTANALAAARDAQLRALRYQLHPHFLFNTLNAISALVVHERNREADRMITHLGDFLRATLESEDCHEHALADELALTESYLNIEKARLGSRLEIGIHVGPDVLQAYVPYMLLQPLMENAIRHGIALRSAGGKIDLNIEHVGDTLQIRLQNEMASPELKPDEVKKNSCGVGLRNVMERLENLYADRHQFSVISEQDAQFLIRITIPYRSASQTQESWQSMPSRAA
jgi:two-component system sensor histidine kinase AlgZ